MSKKLMFYINTLQTGGAERVMSQLAGHFQQRGYDVILVTSYPVQGEYPVAEGVRRIYLQPKKLQGNRLLRNIKLVGGLRKLCRQEKPDALIAFMQEPNFRAVLAGLGLPVKTVVSVRNDPDREYAGTVGRIVGKHLLPLADGCVFQTRQAKAWFPEKLQNKSQIILNEVSDTFFDIQRHAPRHVVTVGRLNAQKNHDLLIRAFAKVTDKYPEQNLLLYGEGDLRPQLENRIRQLGLTGRVQLMGITADVPAALSKAGIFALPSDYEGMPNALMEALAAGVPCISTDCPCGGPQMLIRHNENGLLVPVGDEAAMASALDKLLGDAAFAEKLGKTAKENARQYLPEKIADQWETYLLQVMER